MLTAAWRQRTDSYCGSDGFTWVGNRVGIEIIKAKNKGLRIASKSLFLLVAGATRLELATSGVTGRRSNQTELRPRN